MKINYLETIASPDLTKFVSSAIPVFPKFTTVNQSYKDQLTRVRTLVAGYFADETLRRPLSYLILGPPGAGKSYLMKRLVDQLKESQEKAPKTDKSKKSFVYQSINLSEVVSSSELYRLYEQISKNDAENLYTITLIDEVDVRWANGSAIKHLINPMYDGEYWNGVETRKFPRCAFFFAGSYLQDRETLLRTQRLLTGFDMNRYLLDLYLEMRKRNNVEALRDIKDVQEFCYKQQMWRAHADPDTDTIAYLRSLEKIRDFLSRIAGNFFEMIDVSAPLNITHEAFVVQGGKVTPTLNLKPVDVARFVKRTERNDDDQFVEYRDFEDRYEPLLEYKNVLLCERLLRVIGTIENRFRDSWPKTVKEFKIERKLLNLLALAPLINGMRSLEQLVNLLDASQGTCLDLKSPFKPEEVSMIMHNPEDYADPDRLWSKLKDENSELQKLMTEKNTSDDDLVTVPLSEKK